MQEFEPTTTVKTLHDCLEQEDLSSIVKKAQFLNRFDRFWQSLLPPHLQQRSHIANFTKGTLSIAVDSAQWATELRYSKLTLLQQLQATPFGTELQQIRIYVSPPVVTPTLTYHHKPKLSPSSAQLINETAASITDVKLKSALLRLAKRCPAWVTPPKAQK
ncbi:MAG: DciA family protein [Gammaproteobacteria bacterium]